MASQKQSLPSFASIISVLSIVFYCLGFLRIELELNDQKKRINALENVAENKPSNHPDVTKLAKNAPGKFIAVMLTSETLIKSNFFCFVNHNLCPDIKR